jgi:hypothetical protein
MAWFGPAHISVAFFHPRQKYDVSWQWATTLWTAATYLGEAAGYLSVGLIAGQPPPRREGEFVCRLTAQEDGGIDHGDSRQLRAGKISVDLRAAAGRERKKINSTGGLE